ncbi:hypothetical protein [Streptomyces sp. NPDC059262]
MVPHNIEVPAWPSIANPVPEMRLVPVYRDELVKVTAMLVDHPSVFP